MRKILLILVLSLGLFSAGAKASVAEMKIAVVDMNRALQSVEAGKKAKSDLEKEFNAKKKNLQAEEDAIKKMTEEFKKQSLVLSDDAKAKKNNELQERMMKYSETLRKANMDIQNRERQLTEPLITKLRGIIDDIGQKNGYTIIFEKNENNVLFSLKKDDITEEVIKAFNKNNG